MCSSDLATATAPTAYPGPHRHRRPPPRPPRPQAVLLELELGALQGARRPPATRGLRGGPAPSEIPCDVVLCCRPSTAPTAPPSLVPVGCSDRAPCNRRRPAIGRAPASLPSVRSGGEEGPNCKFRFVFRVLYAKFEDCAVIFVLSRIFLYVVTPPL